MNAWIIELGVPSKYSYNTRKMQVICSLVTKMFDKTQKFLKDFLESKSI